MKIAKIFFHGQFEDAYLYMGRLITIDCDKNVRVQTLKHITDNLASRYTTLAPFYDWLFRRTDWFSNAQAKSLYQNPEYAEIVKASLLQCEQNQIDFNVNSFVPEGTFNLKQKYDSLLDWTIYNGFVYFGTDKGLFHVPADWSDKSVKWNKSIKRTDAKVLHTCARYGRINASCGSGGLLSAFENYDEPTRNTELKVIQSRSVSSSWCNIDLINYTDFKQPNIFRSESDKQQLSMERDTLVVKAFKENSGASVFTLPPKANTAANIDQKSVAYTFNSNQTFYLAHTNTDMYKVHLTYVGKVDPMRENAIRMKALGKTDFADIMSTHPLPTVDSVVVETFDSVTLMTPKALLTLLDEPVISIRTFPQSHQYQNLITIVTDAGLWLISVVDDSIIDKCAIRELKVKEAVAK